MLRKSIRTACMLSVMFGATACAESEPVLDTSTDESSERSMERMRASLSEAERDELEAAITTLAFSSLGEGGIFELAQAGEQGVEQYANSVQESMDGLTASEIISKAESARAEQAERRRRQALIDIDVLEAKKEQAEAQRGELENFKIDSARFYFSESEYSYQATPVIELSVTNNTSEPVSRAYFKGVLSSPGRSIPWLEEPFNYSIPGGIEPGESLDWNLQPNRFSPWGNSDIPEDAVLTITVERLDGVGGEPLWNAVGLTDREMSRLESLKREYGDE